MYVVLVITLGSIIVHNQVLYKEKQADITTIDEVKIH